MLAEISSTYIDNCFNFQYYTVGTSTLKNQNILTQMRHLRFQARIQGEVLAVQPSPPPTQII